MKQKLWGGVFGKNPDQLAWSFGQSVESDAILWEEEIQVSQSHARMLGSAGIISESESEALAAGLGSVAAQIRAHLRISGEPSRALVALAPDAEDIHSAIEGLLQHQVGELVEKLHAGRSRNDQVATVTKLWLRNQLGRLKESAKSLQEVIAVLGTKHGADPMPGFTHMQAAQPVTLGFHLMAYFWMVQRDVERIERLFKSLDLCPLGAAALAGTTLPIDRHMTARELGFAAPSPNALDATSDRDFVGDALHLLAMLMQHLSRLSQELVLWSSPLYGFVRLDEAFATGSSIMPQKRNPDMAELIRGRSARLIGHWTQFMSMMKALPLGYNRDQQEDKPALFDAVGLTLDSLSLCKSMLETAEFQLPRMASTAGNGFSVATGVAEALVKVGYSFRKAHETTGALVRRCEERGITLNELTASDIADLPASVLEETSVAASISSRQSYGGPSHDQLARQIEEAKALLEKD